MEASVQHDTIFSLGTKQAFAIRIEQSPSNRRISSAEGEEIIKWLTSAHGKSSSQKEHSRKNYVRKNFVWDDQAHQLLAVAKDSSSAPRRVIVDDAIVEAVGFVHEQVNHGGWDATWESVNRAYYGILRADVNFLLKRCLRCRQNPSKRPKSLVHDAARQENND